MAAIFTSLELKMAADQELIKAQEEMARKNKALEQAQLAMHQARDKSLSEEYLKAVSWLAQQKAVWQAIGCALRRRIFF